MAEKFMIGFTVTLAAVALIVLLGAAFALPVMWLWNGVLPNLFVANVVKPIDFWNAWGLLILCGLLFKGTSSSSSK
ncbi:MAG TPA: hypothetical protein VG758_21115 [Hyphomicrobiaceae bacterium]|jgi:hypothetical protein|nr:hypothetical protein [Hyphomicrobiaceae bacterium]